jgi:hypothetical protein
MRLTGLPSPDARTLIWIELRRPMLPGTTLEMIADRARATDHGSQRQNA